MLINFVLTWTVSRVTTAPPEHIQHLVENIRVPRGAGSAVHIASIEQPRRSEEHTSELQSLMRISYAVFCLKKTHRTNPHAAHPDNAHRDTTAQQRHHHRVDLLSDAALLRT